ncbi:mechanosensitive ion channel family protein [Kaustia mangrovi]|uniref:Mechanosensitive ion channel family protein n=2 Tax=Kaustia mangrovi TaxID=2593653 RepID=A0A7S8C8P4_9HYPH|nr:mechanosensitive ion channel family protein [Kaustia mangrovi]
MAHIWGLPIVGEGSLIGGMVEIAVIAFVGYMGYHAVRIALDRRIEKEAPQDDGEGSGEAEFGAGESRLATLLPLFRNFLLITIATMTAMIVLAELGVNIGPIFAGAGVVGLAIGFGAQTLVRDIFSGAFFLIDDAFRKGEYIDIGTVKGTVEKISIRSMQLRHHRGPLNTVPFGEIKFVQNFSRDWAIMKLAFRVTYDTDPEHVRKVIKKLGQELQEHPDYGPLFLQPLKSQGVLAMEDSAMIVRVKFMTRPGDQFTLRKAVYGGIRDAFAREGIKFAHRQVSVRVTQDGGDEAEPLSEAAVKQVAGAAARIAEDEEAARQAAGGANKPG